jgi:hypothetical protein
LFDDNFWGITRLTPAPDHDIGVRWEYHPMLEFLTNRENREIAEFLFWCAGVVLAIVTTVTILYARAQVKESRKYSEIIAKQAQATLLLDLMDKWNSEKMQEARKIFLAQESAAKDIVSQKYTKLSDQEFTSKFEEHFKKIADSLRADNIFGDYHTMMRIMDFLESIGLLVKKKVYTV